MQKKYCLVEAAIVLVFHTSHWPGRPCGLESATVYTYCIIRVSLMIIIRRPGSVHSDR